jgi:signal transduction histidine kinase
MKATEVPNYNYNNTFLFFEDKQIERAFNRGRYRQDLQSLRFVLGFATVLSICYLFFDLYRYTDNINALIFRGGLALVLMTFVLATYLIQPSKYKQLQFLAFFIAIFTAVVGFLQNTLEEQGELFLSNFLSSGIFLSCTILGLRFRYVLPLITIFLVAYLIHVSLMDYGVNDYQFTQIPQLFTFYVIGVITSYLWDKQKMVLFMKESKLHQQYDTVDKLNHVKDRLFSTISHDVRGPIMNLKGVIELFKKGAISDSELKQLVQSLDKEIGKTSTLIDNLLAWSKTQLKGIEITKEKYQLKPQLEKLLELYRAQVEEKNLTLQLSISDDDTIFADREMMLIVFRNLLSNAIKFTPIGGKIEINGHEITNEHCYLISIKDNGKGIASEKIKNLFKIEKDRILGTTHDRGAGLGLTLVKEFIDLNNGEINCSSKLGSGTTFEIKLPHPVTKA